MAKLIYFPHPSNVTKLSSEQWRLCREVFGGDPLPLMLHLADNSKLKGADLEELKKLIEKQSE